MKVTNARVIGEIINDEINTLGLRDNFDAQKASYIWSEIVGAEINRLTFKRYVDNGKLHVYLSSAAVKQELAYRRDNLLKHINNAVGREIINDIIIH